MLRWKVWRSEYRTLRNRRPKARTAGFRIMFAQSHCHAAKKEVFELEDKYEAAKFEKELLLQVSGEMHYDG